jgi:hypothetical protein
METPFTVLTVGSFVTRIAEIAGTKQPNAGEGGIQLIDEALRDRREDLLELETGSHLERDLLQAIHFSAHS